MYGGLIPEWSHTIVDVYHGGLIRFYSAHLHSHSTAERFLLTEHTVQLSCVSFKSFEITAVLNELLVCMGAT